MGENAKHIVFSYMKFPNRISFIVRIKKKRNIKEIWNNLNWLKGTKKLLLFFFFLILSDHELYHLTSKPISDEKDTFKSFMTFDIMPCMPVLIMVIESQIVVPPTSPPSQWHFMTRTHDLGFVIICQTISCVTLPQNQLVMRKTHSNFLWH